MDNLAHALVGAALGQAGLKKKTGLGMATLVIAANLPDIDAFGLLFGENLAWRRGWTHGPLAWVVLPLILTFAVVAFDRWQIRTGKRPRDRLPVRAQWVLALSYIGLLSHPLLDLLNTYGVRCLMPFSQKWFYGDTLFIIDIWMWLTLGFGVWLSGRRYRFARAGAATPAIAALALMFVYTGLMFVGGRVAEAHVAQVVERETGEAPRRVLASPVPINPFARRIVYDLGEAYGFGDFTWWMGPRYSPEKAMVPVNMGHPAIARAAREHKAVGDFLYWSRYPFAQVERTADGYKVTVGDARYNSGPNIGRFQVSARVADTDAATPKARSGPE